MLLVSPPPDPVRRPTANRRGRRPRRPRRLALLAELSVGAVLLAPAHSYPTGAVLSPQRRIELLDWARAADALIIEDDYDAEFRYDRNPIGALQGLAPDHVVYGASTSKILSPALRIGWLATPAWLIGDLLRAKFLDDIATETLGQLTLARFIDSGDLARHLRRVRPIYRARRDALLQALADFLPDANPTGVAAGLHLSPPYRHTAPKTSCSTPPANTASTSRAPPGTGPTATTPRRRSCSATQPCTRPPPNAPSPPSAPPTRQSRPRADKPSQASANADAPRVGQPAPIRHRTPITTGCHPQRGSPGEITALDLEQTQAPAAVAEAPLLSTHQQRSRKPGQRLAHAPRGAGATTSSRPSG